MTSSNMPITEIVYGLRPKTKPQETKRVYRRAGSRVSELIPTSTLVALTELKERL